MRVAGFRGFRLSGFRARECGAVIDCCCCGQAALCGLEYGPVLGSVIWVQECVSVCVCVRVHVCVCLLAP